eukprot:Em0014g547a
MPSRQEKKRAKRRAKYLEVRDDVLESARASYKADPEKKRTGERERYHADPVKKRSAKRKSYDADPEKKRSAKRESYEADPEKKRSAKRESYKADPEKKRAAKRESYKADPEKKRSAKRESYEADPEKKQTAERERYHADPKKKRSAKRKRYWEDPECSRLAKRVRYGKAKRALQNQRGHRKRTTDRVIPRAEGVGYKKKCCLVVPRGHNISRGGGVAVVAVQEEAEVEEAEVEEAEVEEAEVEEAEVEEAEVEEAEVEEAEVEEAEVEEAEVEEAEVEEAQDEVAADEATFFPNFDANIRVDGFHGHECVSRSAGMTVAYLLYRVFQFATANADNALCSKRLKAGYLHGKVVWITGASSGIGEALSYELSSLDVKLILSARSEDKLVALRDKLKTPENVRSSFRDIKEQVGRTVMEVDFFGPVLLTQALLPVMLSNGFGHIVNISSIAGKLPVQVRSYYCAAKTALIALMNVVRLEVGCRGVMVL